MIIHQYNMQIMTKIRRWYRNYKIRRALRDPECFTKISQILMDEIRDNFDRNRYNEIYVLGVPKFIGKFPIRKDFPTTPMTANKNKGEMK
jgi:hypothetical protein